VPGGDHVSDSGLGCDEAGSAADVEPEACVKTRRGWGAATLSTAVN